MTSPRSVRSMLFALAAFTAALTAAAAEPTGTARVAAGDPSVDGTFLRPYENRWTFSIQKKGGEPVPAGTWTDRLEATSVGGRKALKRTQVASYKNGIQLTLVNVFDPKTMESASADYRRSDTGETRHLEFHGRQVSFRRLPGTGDGLAQNYVATVEQRILDYHDGLYGILLDTLPLSEGYDVSVAAFDTDRAALDWVRVKVTGRETVEAGPGRRAETWVVRVDTARYGYSIWWLTREAPYVIKATLVLPEDEGGFTVSYTMA